MKRACKFFFTTVIAAICSVVLSSFFNQNESGKAFSFPYKQAGLTERQAAAHLLSRFTYGATPGQVDAVTAVGVENWFLQQLNANLPDDSLNNMLNGYDAIKMNNTEIVKVFPKGGELLRMAVQQGIISKDSAKTGDKKEYRAKIAAFMLQNGMRPEQELFRQFINQKIVRASYSNNQLQEILTDFWFNHFNVSITKNDCAQFIPVYERDAIRPNVLGKFQNLLMATAKSPAMLLYLDNFTSMANNPAMQRPAIQKPVSAQMRQQMDLPTLEKEDMVQKAQQVKRVQGLNENYAREVMELHTLGVDGGYTQQDVTQAAKVLTGWTIYPMSDRGYGSAIKKTIDKIGEDRLSKAGFVHEGDFLFAANRHDITEKTVLGKKFGPNGGYQEGVELLTMLAHHPSTAKFICKKIAVRFVSDDPAQSLVDKMAKTFTEKDGDIKQVLITMVTSPEFWNKEALREKTKSPFELAISTVRSLNASVKQPYQLFTWIDKMGQKMYFYQAPTGFPDKGQYWINTGALLNRMNFGLALASQRIPGITFDLAALNNHHEPESAEAGLVTYSKLMMPERNVDETVKRLTPLLNDPNLGKKVDDAVGKTEPQRTDMINMDDMTINDDMKMKRPRENPRAKNQNNSFASMQTATGNNSMLSQVVGIIIGSPEFQRK